MLLSLKLLPPPLVVLEAGAELLLRGIAAGAADTRMRPACTLTSKKKRRKHRKGRAHRPQRLLVLLVLLLLYLHQLPPRQPLLRRVDGRRRCRPPRSALLQLLLVPPPPLNFQRVRLGVSSAAAAAAAALRPPRGKHPFAPRPGSSATTETIVIATP